MIEHDRLIAPGPASPAEEAVERALAAGAECARALWAGGLIRGAVLVCQGRYALVDDTGHALAAMGDTGRPSQRDLQHLSAASRAPLGAAGGPAFA